jgi:hypothetical protein
MLKGARGHQVPWRIIRSVFKSASVAVRTCTRGSYRRGEAYFRDPVHGGMDHYSSTPETMALQLQRAGLQIIETVGGHFPTVRSAALTPWHYYACCKV